MTDYNESLKKMNKATLKTELYRLLTGPSYLIDGIVLTLTFGRYHPSIALKCAKKLALSRMKK